MNRFLFWWRCCHLRNIQNEASAYYTEALTLAKSRGKSKAKDFYGD